MQVVIIVNIIVSIGLFLGGSVMKKYAKSPADYTIGFRTKASMASEDAWYFANNRCGGAWTVIGIAALLITIAAVFAVTGDKASGIAQCVVMVLQVAAASAAVTSTELILRQKFN